MSITDKLPFYSFSTGICIIRNLEDGKDIASSYTKLLSDSTYDCIVDLCAVNLLEAKRTGSEEIYPKVTFTSKERRSVLWRVKHLVQLILLAPLAPLLYFTVASAKEWYDRNCKRVFIGKEIHEFIINPTFYIDSGVFWNHSSEEYKAHFEAKTLPKELKNHTTFNRGRPKGTTREEFVQENLARAWMRSWISEIIQTLNEDISQKLIIPSA